MRGQDDPDEVLGWIQRGHITFLMNLILNDNLVSMYLRHKRSGDYKHNRKCGNVFITRCRFGLSHLLCVSAKLNSVSVSLN